MVQEQSKDWCCVLCGRLIKGMCENDEGYITCLNEDCIGEGEKQDTLQLLEQMFCEGEGILSKFSEVSTDTIEQWLEEKDIEGLILEVEQ